MAMNMLDQTYQPVNIGQGFSEAFARGASAVPDLGARIAEMFSTSMAQQGAMQRGMIAEQGETARSKERNKTTLMAAGMGPEGKGMTLAEAMEQFKNMPQNAAFTFTDPSGAKITIGSKLDQTDKLIDAATKQAREIFPGDLYDNMDPVQKGDILMEIMNRIGPLYLGESYVPGATDNYKKLQERLAAEAALRAKAGRGGAAGFGQNFVNSVGNIASGFGNVVKAVTSPFSAGANATRPNAQNQAQVNRELALQLLQKSRQQ
jgi:hypothetical protein